MELGEPQEASTPSSRDDPRPGVDMQSPSYWIRRAPRVGRRSTGNADSFIIEDGMEVCCTLTAFLR